MPTSIRTILGSDLPSNSRTDINNNFASLNANKIETSVISTDNTLGGITPSDSKLPTEKAVADKITSVLSPTGKSWNEYAVANSGTDSYTITVPGLVAYAVGQTFKFKADVANIGACTLNVNGLGAKTIKKEVSNDLITGDILLNQIVEVKYDGVNMQMSTFVPSQIPTSSVGVSKVKTSGIGTIDAALSFDTEIYTEVGSYLSGGVTNIINLSATSDVRGGSVSAGSYAPDGQKFTVTGNGGMLTSMSIRHYTATSGGTVGIQVRRVSDNVVVATGGGTMTPGSDITETYPMSAAYLPAGDYYVVFIPSIRDIAICYRNTDVTPGTERWSINASTGNLIAAQTGTDISVTINIDSRKIFKVTSTGTYLLSFNYVANTVGARSATVYVNGVAQLSMSESTSSTNSMYNQTIIKLTLGDYIWVITSSDYGAGTSLELVKLV